MSTALFLHPLLVVTPADNQVVLALIGLLVVIVGAAQAIVVAYYGSHARRSAHRAANNAQSANAQAYIIGREVKRVGEIVNGQTTALLAHNRVLEQTLAQAGIEPPPPPIVESEIRPSTDQEPLTGGTDDTA